MFQLQFLGTSASIPSVERNQPALLVSAFGRRILVDCGEGTQRQLLRAGAGLRRLDRILLTHGHPDHILGFPGLLSTLGQQHEQHRMTLWAGADAAALVARVLAAYWGDGQAPVSLDCRTLAPGPVIAEPSFSVDAFPVRHRGTDSFGFVFRTPVRRHLLADRLTALGIPDGPIRSELAAGIPVRLDDGTLVDPETVLGPPAAGAKLVVIGDAETTEGLEASIAESDALVIEATFLDRDAEIARRYGHLTAAEAARAAAALGVRRLILVHQSGRYKPGEILAEAQALFPQTVVADDFDRVEVG